MFPKAAVGSVIGIGGMSGAIGGALFQLATGYIVKLTNSYVPLFAVACSALPWLFAHHPCHYTQADAGADGAESNVKIDGRAARRIVGGGRIRKPSNGAQEVLFCRLASCLRGIQ